MPVPHRRWRAALAVAAALLVATACQPVNRPLTTQYTTTVVAALTPDGGDRYTFHSTTHGMIVRAPTTNAGSNLRMVGYKRAWPASVDQEACVTWASGADQLAQPGIALRIVASDQRVRSILVTNNILFGQRRIFNVHLGDTAASQPLVKVGSAPFDWASKVELPWTLCARAVGRTITLKVWPAGDQPTAPAWDDPEHTASFTVPQAWATAGRPGFYAGHLAAGQELTYSAISGGPVPAT
jgi:hypothetical protein